MSSEIDGLFQESRVKRWLAAQVAAFVVWLSVASVMALVGVAFLFQVLVLVLAAFGFSFVIDPRRSWWGAGPTQVLNDPAALRRYRRSMGLRLVAVLLIAIVVVVLVVATGIVGPVGA